MAFLVSSTCPECGAPTKHHEGALTFKCQYCASVLRMQAEGMTLKYIIPARLDEKAAALAIKKLLVNRKITPVTKVKKVTVIYDPFWNLRGMLFYLVAGDGKAEISAKTWFHSFQANETFLPSFTSLGIQSQVLELEHYDAEKFPKSAVLLPTTLIEKDALKAAKKAATAAMDMDGKRPGFSDLKMVGEKLSIIYYPVISVVCEGETGYHTIMVDGVNGNLLAEEAGRIETQGIGESDTVAVPPKLITHRCPNCGHNLKDGDFDLTFHCGECRRLWMLKDNDYASIKINAIRPMERGGAYIPFWRFKLEISSGEGSDVISKIGDRAKIMKGGGFNLRNEDPERDITFYVPAIVTRNASGLLSLAIRINIFQKDLPPSDGEAMPDGEAFGLSLAEEEAREMLEPLVFAVTGRIDAKMIAFYNNIQIEVKKSDIVWYPVSFEKDMLVDRYHEYHFPKRWLDTDVY